MLCEWAHLVTVRNRVVSQTSADSSSDDDDADDVITIIQPAGSYENAEAGISRHQVTPPLDSQEDYNNTLTRDSHLSHPDLCSATSIFSWPGTNLLIRVHTFLTVRLT